MGGRSLLVCGIVLLACGPVAAQEAAAPPCSAAEHRQFDFWLGEWKVTTPDGTHAGDNVIEKILDGCALMENWTGSGGTRGHSFNIYSSRNGQWHQTWVDSNGTLLQLDGGIDDGRMVLSGSGTAPDGTPVKHEISWELLDDGRVRQHWRVTRDGGASWRDVFVGLYARR